MAVDKKPSSRSRTPLPSWVGLTLRNWRALLALKPTIDAAFWPRIAGLSAASVFNSALAGVEKAIYGRRVEKTQINRPIFVLGHWRSGTTLLHQLLSRDEQFAAPTLFECTFPGHFLLSKSWLAPLTEWLQPRTRPMDAVENGWDAPAEEEIALLILTLLSPYLVSAFPDRPEEVQRFNSLASGLSESELTRWKTEYVRFLKKLSLKHGRRVILKSPANTARLPLLLSMFPDAEFIHIVRNPYDVFSSTLHLHRVLSRENSFTSAPPANLEERVLSSYVAMYHSYHLYRMKIPAQRRYEIRFEDLEVDPVGELEKIYTHFGWQGADRIGERLAPDLQRHREFQKNHFTLPVEMRRLVAKHWEPVFLRYGYPVDGAPEHSTERVSAQVSPSWTR
ncbi:hypothetical protein AYO47_03095 [Planctomyces sp. SCGC AG-212-M04]|nr:hypothetical protein AYO47_03095 [Planctomyces sp. SCGC AG-212-M04]